MDEVIEGMRRANETGTFLLRQGGHVVLGGVSIVPRSTLADEWGPFAELLIGAGPRDGKPGDALTVRPGDSIPLHRGDLMIVSVRESRRATPGGLVLAFQPRERDPGKSADT